MQKKDIFIIISIAVVSGIFSLIVFNALLGGENKYTLTAPKVDPISAEFNAPDNKYYSKEANPLNPTVVITLDASQNPLPVQTSN